MTDTRILKRLHAAATQLRKAARWKGSSIGVDATTDSYVFELLCFFDVALASGGLTPTIVARTDRRKGRQPIAKWPKSPAEMSNYSYLLLTDKTTGDLVYRLCPGIKIEDTDGKKRAPDVNLLVAGTSEKPVHTDLVLSWDAKFVTDPAGAMSDVGVADFIYTLNHCLQPSGSRVRWLAETTEKRYRASGLVTNGDMSSERDAALKRAGIFETARFPLNPSTRP